FNGSNIGDLFEEVEDRKRSEEERYKKMDEIWKRLSEVDRMILESYYLDGCKMEDIAKRIGYKNGNSVKSRKNKVLKRIMEITKEEEMDFKDMSLAA
ncbi:MAG: hypothetical protein K5893_07780, partial [Prevotella sp.]|nr:hypothetical protein [Prevotella sp.]